jgi:group I intron endonuclease
MIIYKHTCTITGKCYIGLTVKTIKDRWAEHCSDARRYKKRKFYAALNKYGHENWTHEIIFESQDEQEIIEKEIEFINLFDSVNNGYNTSKERFRTGIKHSQESIEKMKIAQKKSQEMKALRGTNRGWKRKDGGPMKGKSHPGKGKSNANKGQKLGQTWEEIYGIEGANKRREAIKNRKLKKVTGGEE